MNKQEAIEKLQSEAVNHYSETSGWFKEIKLDIVTDIVNQIYEPKKPVVPQIVADFYESIKDDFEDKLYDLCVQHDNDSDELSREVWDWLVCIANKPIETLVKMKLYGYEVEKEKLYTVEIPNPNGLGHTVLVKDIYANIFITRVMNSDWQKSKVSQLTEAEIKKDFKWAWKFAKEV